MVGKDGKVIAEPNDPNHVRANVTNYLILTNGRPCIGRGGKSVVAWGPKKGILTSSASGTPAIIETSANKYLCTDANGNLIFKEL